MMNGYFTHNNARRMPEGIQSFEELILDGYVYVDKTDIMWMLANGRKFNYLSRPRRFGKSLLIDTLRCYFEGRKELFEGLKIMELEKEWKVSPVIRFDMSCAGASAEDVSDYFNSVFRECEDIYNVQTFAGDGLTTRFRNILRTASKEGENPVVILIDEYDSPLQHSWHTPEHEACTAIYRNVFAVLKSCTLYERFVFLTGITKFTQISLFSVLNNLTNISFMPQYAALCGITKQEIRDNFMPEIEAMAKKNGWTVEQTFDKLKYNYDGYHFSEENMVDVYNPYSLVIALAQGRTGNYWASSGATSMLPKFVDNLETEVEDLERTFIRKHILESSDVTGGGANLFLYQSGYLTIKDFNDTGYYLGIPNNEIRQALYDIVIPALTFRSQSEVSVEQDILLDALNYGMVEKAMKVLKAMVADVPYSNKKLQGMHMEERYRFIISCIFRSIGMRVEVEHMMPGGRIDIVAWALHAVYVIELKLQNNGGLEAAKNQILANRYAEPFKGDSRKVIALAIELDDNGKGLVDFAQVTVTDSTSQP